jgi:transcriptional antiterminator RfaH
VTDNGAASPWVSVAEGRIGMSSAERGWYAVATKPRQEDLVARIYAVSDIEYFLPKVTLPKSPSTPECTILKPLFPGYLFARVSPESEQWARVNYTPGVKGVVTFGGIPPRVPDSVISELKARTMQGTVRDIEARSLPSFSEGETVVVRKGPLSGLTAVFKGYVSDNGRVRLLIELLRRCAEIETWADHIEKTG